MAAYIGLTGIAAVIFNAFVTIMVAGLSYALSYANRPSMPKTNKPLARGQLVNTSDSQAPIPVIYGRQKVGINRVYVGTDGTDNNILHIVGVVCEGEIEGLASIGGVPQLYLNDKIYTEYGSLVAYEFFTGSPTQTVCATLQAAIPGWTDPLKYTAYIYVKLTYDQNYFQSLPEITMIIDGLKVYDPGTETTAYSTNPALITNDFMTRSSRRGGMGIDSARINSTSVSDAASYCDTKGWTCNIALIDNNAAIDSLNMLFSSYRGEVVYSSTEFKIKYRDLNYESTVMDIDEDDVAESGNVSSLTITQPDIFETPNAVNIKYINSEKLYQMDDYILADSAAIAADGDFRQNEINLRAITNQTNIMKMANYYLERLRYNKTIYFNMGTRGAALEPFDLIRVTHSRPGWSYKVFRVQEPKVNFNGEVVVSAEEELSTFYDDTYNITAQAWHDTTLPNPMDAVISVADASITEEQYNYRDRTYTRLKVSFTAPPAATYPFWDHADVYVKVTAAGDWKFMTKAISNYMLDPVEEGVAYFFKIVSVSTFNTKEAFNDACEVSKTVLGRQTNPDDITGFTALAAGDAIIMFATQLTDPDISGYEVRLGDSWAGGLFVGFNETPNLRLAGVRPGTHTFWMCAKDNSGAYSENPADAQVTVFYPPGYSDKNTWSWDFNGIGSHSNTEHCTHNATDALKCSHTSDVLTGTWTSPEYDLGSLKTVRVWGDFLTDFTSSSGTWAGLVGTLNWSDVLSGTTKWYQLTSPPYSGILRATIKWGTSSGVYPNSATGFELSSVEISARYIQVEVTIEDPFLDTNLYLYELNMKAAYWS